MKIMGSSLLLFVFLPAAVFASCVPIHDNAKAGTDVRGLTEEQEFEHYVAVNDVIAAGTVVEVAHWNNITPAMDEIRFAVARGVKGASQGDTITFWENKGIGKSDESWFEAGEECMVFLDRDKVSGALHTNAPYMDKYEISDECIAHVGLLVDENRRYNIYDRSDLVVHGVVIGSTRLPGGGHHHGHVHDHHHDHSHAHEERDHLCSILGEIPKVWPDCEYAAEGVLIDVEQVLKGSAVDTVKVAIQRVYVGAYPQFEEQQEVLVFLEPLERDFYRLVGYKRSKVLLKDGKVAGKETPQEFIERIAAKGD